MLGDVRTMILDELPPFSWRALEPIAGLLLGTTTHRLLKTLLKTDPWVERVFVDRVPPYMVKGSDGRALLGLGLLLQDMQSEELVRCEKVGFWSDQAKPPIPLNLWFRL